MIRINLAPPRERAGVRLGLPQANLGMLFGVAAVALAVILIGSSLYLCL